MSVTPFDIKTILLAKHTQHVVLIHFPIALFIAGMAFDLVTQWTKRRGLADAANLLLAAISTVPVIATGILAWQFALDGQKLRGILLHMVLGRPAQSQCNERRLPWNSGSTLRRCGCAPRDRHGGSASRRCSARAHEMDSTPRLVSVRNRTP
jgi:hypothetical protein